ncbi:DUF2753 family protein [Vibrio proteolyticus]|uniref:DUF2753 domain-containing protein n=1 Tax=Vibrio proteolyticus NBRC 13287 TaxID=1219065 RepID=U2ZWN8_VIBPR|nr:DUF2753 family protein [Vibrio proteolyticus]GAD65825.1 hypothetical protein VPR01S_02_00760 [Vibrio proteolyticus NBRC 13287]
MSIHDWEQHTLLADTAMSEQDHLRSILHYQQALALSEHLSLQEEIDLEERLMISVISCHNLAQFWRSIGDDHYEIKYLQLASEKVLMLVPQCHNPNCEAFIDSLGCCKKALIEFMKRHPDPRIAHQVKDIDSVTNCNQIARFKLN